MLIRKLEDGDEIPITRDLNLYLDVGNQGIPEVFLNSLKSYGNE